MSLFQVNTSLFLLFIPYVHFAYTDFHTQKIPNRNYGLAVVYTIVILIIYEPNSLNRRGLIYLLILIFLLAFTLLLESLLTQELMGGGDIKIIALLFLAYPMRTAMLAWFSSSLFAALFLLVRIILRKINVGRQSRSNLSAEPRSFDHKYFSVVYAPFLSFSLLLVLLLQHYYQ